MAVSTITELSTALKAGARPNFFMIDFTIPTFVSAETAANLSLLCKSAAVPGMTLGVIEIPFRGGRRIKIPGDRTFADWTVTFISDSAHKIRGTFLQWHNAISKFDFDSSTLRPAKNSGYDYSVDITVDHLKQDGSSVRKYKLFEAFPTDIGAIDLSFDSTDSISEFTVTFQYHHMQVGFGATA